MLLGVCEAASAIGTKDLVSRIVLVVDIFSGKVVGAGIHSDRVDAEVYARRTGEITLALDSQGVNAAELWLSDR